MNEIIRKIDEEIEYCATCLKNPYSNKVHHKGVEFGLKLAKEIIQAEQKEPKTNGDRIRESNESLVEYLSGVILTLNKDVVLEWLDEPVSEDN